MYVTNIESLSKDELFTCGKTMSKYLIKHGAYLLSNKDGIYYFAKNDKLKGIYNMAPFYLKMMERW
jgi:hypothetical protein